MNNQDTITETASTRTDDIFNQGLDEKHLLEALNRIQKIDEYAKSERLM